MKCFRQSSIYSLNNKFPTIGLKYENWSFQKYLSYFHYQIRSNLLHKYQLFSGNFVLANGYHNLFSQTTFHLIWHIFAKHCHLWTSPWLPAAEIPSSCHIHSAIPLVPVVLKTGHYHWNSLGSMSLQAEECIIQENSFHLSCTTCGNKEKNTVKFTVQ